jgi:hypothetical protein
VRVTGVSEPRPGKDNEDLLLVRDGLVLVLDGCGVSESLAATLDRGCVHGVPWYARTLGAELASRAADRAVPLPDALAGAIEATRAAHGPTCDLTNPDTPASTVVALREHDDRLDYLVLSDSCLVLDTTIPDTTIPDTTATATGTGQPGPDGLLVITDQRVEAALPPPVTLPLGDPGRAAADAERSRLRRARQNRPGGYWIASTDPAAGAEALTGSVPVASVRRAMLASDGGVRLVEFGELTVAAALELAATAGPAALVARTREAEAADPRAVRWPRGKQYDDATVAVCTFG